MVPGTSYLLTVTHHTRPRAIFLYCHSNQYVGDNNVQSIPRVLRIDPLLRLSGAQQCKGRGGHIYRSKYLHRTNRRIDLDRFR